MPHPPPESTWSQHTPLLHPLSMLLSTELWLRRVRLQIFLPSISSHLPTPGQPGSRPRFPSRKALLIDPLQKAYWLECTSLGLWNAKGISNVPKALIDSFSHHVRQPHYSFLQLWRTLSWNSPQASPSFSSQSFFSNYIIDEPALLRVHCVLGSQEELQKMLVSGMNLIHTCQPQEETQEAGCPLNHVPLRIAQRSRIRCV